MAMAQLYRGTLTVTVRNTSHQSVSTLVSTHVTLSIDDGLAPQSNQYVRAVDNYGAEAVAH